MTVYIPLNPDKTPAARGWQKAEFTGPVPNGEAPSDGEWLGLRADGLVIIDCDSDEALQRWVEFVGERNTLTFTVKTPRGWHLYYRFTPGSPTGPAVGILPSVDLRAGSGSYVVSSCAPGYEQRGDRPILSFDPAWMPAKPEKDTGSGAGWDVIPEGTRNDTLAAFAGTLRSRGMSASKIAETLYAMNKTFCDPPLDNEEVVLIAKSIGRYEPEPTAQIVVLPETPEGARDTGMWGHELESFHAPPIEWIVDGLIPEGLTLLAGKPKVGKSWMSLGLAAACAEGSEYLGRGVPKGKALYLALEDTLPRAQRRLRKVQAGEPFPPDLRVETMWPRCPDAATQIVSFIKENPETKLVIIDTLAKVRHEAGERAKGTYQDDYQALGDLKRVADHFHIAVVVVHHLRKGGAEDPLDEVSGTTGLAGAADTILVLKQDIMEGRGRDLEDDVKYDVVFDRDSCKWRILGDADFAIVLDLGAWLIDHGLPGDTVKPALARDSGLWSQQEFEKQWTSLHDDERFVSVRNDPSGPLMIAQKALEA